jgi:hypothetical protein
LSNWNINHLLQLYFIQFGQSFSFRFVSFRLAALSKSTGPCEPLVSRSTIDWLQVKDIFEKVGQQKKLRVFTWNTPTRTHPHTCMTSIDDNFVLLLQANHPLPFQISRQQYPWDELNKFEGTVNGTVNATFRLLSDSLLI